MTDNFGSLESFRVKFREAAAGHFASGWVFLVADARKSALEVLALPDHHCVLGTHQTVLLVCDVLGGMRAVAFTGRCQGAARLWMPISILTSMAACW